MSNRFQYIKLRGLIFRGFGKGLLRKIWLLCMVTAADSQQITCTKCTHIYNGKESKKQKDKYL